MEFYEYETHKCPLTGGNCIEKNCRFFKAPGKLPAKCRASEVLSDYENLFKLLGNFVSR